MFNIGIHSNHEEKFRDEINMFVNYLRDLADEDNTFYRGRKWSKYGIGASDNGTGDKSGSIDGSFRSGAGSVVGNNILADALTKPNIVIWRETTRQHWNRFPTNTVT